MNREAQRAALLVAPFEETSSFVRGSAAGPEAVAEELNRIELFDPEVPEGHIDKANVVQLPVSWSGLTLAEACEKLERRATEEMALGRFVLTLGGEHTVTVGPLRAALARWGRVGVIQLDAHGDLRDSYEGRKLSHGCVMRRAHELGIPILGLGIRSMSCEEAELIEADAGIVHLSPRALRDNPSSLEEAILGLPEKIYLTIDMDAFDPAVAPGVGTPEAGGLSWSEVAHIIDVVAAHRRIVAADVLELAPNVEREVTVRLAARVVVRVLLRSIGQA